MQLRLKYAPEPANAARFAADIVSAAAAVSGVQLNYTPDSGTWRLATEREQSLFGFPMVIELPAQKVCNPIGKVFKRLENGPADNLRYFYTIFANRPSQ